MERPGDPQCPPRTLETAHAILGNTGLTPSGRKTYLRGKPEARKPASSCVLPAQRLPEALHVPAGDSGPQVPAGQPSVTREVGEMGVHGRSVPCRLSLSHWGLPVPRPPPHTAPGLVTARPRWGMGGTVARGRGGGGGCSPGSSGLQRASEFEGDG